MRFIILLDALVLNIATADVVVWGRSPPNRYGFPAYLH